MINEQYALVMLDGKVSDGQNNTDLTAAFYKSMQSFASASLDLCEKGNVRKFEEHLKVALKLFSYGNANVKNGIINVYLFTISYALDKQTRLLSIVERLFPIELKKEYSRLHYIGGM